MGSVVALRVGLMCRSVSGEFIGFIRGLSTGFYVGAGLGRAGVFWCLLLGNLGFWFFFGLVGFGVWLYYDIY